MNYKDLHDLEFIPRDEIKTLYSLGHYDGPRSGLVLWDDKLYFALVMDEISPRRFYLFDMPEDKLNQLVAWVQEWVREINNAIAWDPNGFKTSVVHSDKSEIEIRDWRIKNPVPPYHDWLWQNNYTVIGYFVGWRQ